MSDTIKETPEVRSEAEAVSENIPPELWDALSPITAIRQSWCDNLPLPRFELGPGVKKMERLNKSGTSGYGNVYKVEVNGEEENEFHVQVYEIKDDHTATFNWYSVDKITGEVKELFP